MKCGICKGYGKEMHMAIWIGNKLINVHDNDECQSQALEFWEARSAMKKWAQ